MVPLTDKDTGETCLVNQDYVMYVVPKPWGSLLVVTGDLVVEVQETTDEVWQAMDLEVEWDDPPDEGSPPGVGASSLEVPIPPPPEKISEQVRVSGVPYLVPADSLNTGGRDTTKNSQTGDENE